MPGSKHGRGGEEEWGVGEKEGGSRGSGKEGGGKGGWGRGEGIGTEGGKRGALSALSPGPSTGPGTEEVLIIMSMWEREKRREPAMLTFTTLLNALPRDGADI